jgi:hypothetical protein
MIAKVNNQGRIECIVSTPWNTNGTAAAATVEYGATVAAELSSVGILSA